MLASLISECWQFKIFQSADIFIFEMLAAIKFRDAGNYIFEKYRQLELPKMEYVSEMRTFIFFELLALVFSEMLAITTFKMLVIIYFSEC